MKQIVSAAFGLGCRHLILSEYPFQAFHSQTSHILHAVVPCHDDIHAREASHRTNVNHIFLSLRIAEPSGHQVLQAVDGGGSHCRLLVGFGDAKVECCEAFVLSRHIDTRLQVGVVNGETFNNFHIKSEL